MKVKISSHDLQRNIYSFFYFLTYSEGWDSETGMSYLGCNVSSGLLKAVNKAGIDVLRSPGALQWPQLYQSVVVWKYVPNKKIYMIMSYIFSYIIYLYIIYL